MSHISWSEFKRKGKLMDPEWVDHDVPPNGIGSVCKECHNLIDWDPVDHKVDCFYVGETMVVSTEFLWALKDALISNDKWDVAIMNLRLTGMLREDDGA